MFENLKLFKKKILDQIFAKPQSTRNTSNIFVGGLWIVRMFTFATGFYQIINGEFILGIPILLSLLFLIAPDLITRNRIIKIPIEMQFIFFTAVIVQFIFGEVRGFYRTVPYYDKLVHLFIPFLVGFTGFMVTYTLYFTKRLRVSILSMIVFSIFLSIGIGAIWEILEFLNDEYLIKIFPVIHRLQGSQSQTALHDTMYDLIADLVGGTVGAVIASIYVLRNRYSNERLREVFREIKRNIIK